LGTNDQSDNSQTKRAAGATPAFTAARAAHRVLTEEELVETVRVVESRFRADHQIPSGQTLTSAQEQLFESALYHALDFYAVIPLRIEEARRRATKKTWTSGK
jgi:hypothetical protein